MKPARRGSGENGFFQFVELVAYRLDQRVVGVDHRIDEGISQVVRAHPADRPLADPDPFPHRIEHVAIALLQREYVVPPDEETDLLRVNPSPLAHTGHAGDEEVLVFVTLGLRALRYVNGILQRERMDTKNLADLAQNGLISQSLHIHPGHALGAGIIAQLFGIHRFVFPHSFGGVAYQVDDRLGRIRFGYQRARHRAHRRVPLAEVEQPRAAGKDGFAEQIHGGVSSGAGPANKGGRPGPDSLPNVLHGQLQVGERNLNARLIERRLTSLHYTVKDRPLQGGFVNPDPPQRLTLESPRPPATTSGAGLTMTPSTLRTASSSTSRAWVTCSL